MTKMHLLIVALLFMVYSSFAQDLDNKATNRVTPKELTIPVVSIACMMR